MEDRHCIDCENALVVGDHRPASFYHPEEFPEAECVNTNGDESFERFSDMWEILREYKMGGLSFIRKYDMGEFCPGYKKRSN